jgi:putative mRNA 3-end processing factor
VLFAYALGKAQRVLLGLAQLSGALPGPVYVHGAVARIDAAYRDAGVAWPDAPRVANAPAGTRFADALILAPPSARGSTWLRRFEPCSTAFASGWMALRGTRRRAALDRGFALSDHADWPALLAAVDASGAGQVLVTHGYRDELARWLAEHGRDAQGVDTPFEGEPADASEGGQAGGGQADGGQADGGQVDATDHDPAAGADAGQQEATGPGAADGPAPPGRDEPQNPL